MFAKLFGPSTDSRLVTIDPEVLQDLRSKLAAVDRSQGVIEFTLDGKILDANQNFLSLLGYSLEDIQGKNHSMFVAPSEVNSPGYREFWQKLGSGTFDTGRYRRFGKGGREIWIQASYTPVLDASGKPYKVVKFASDISAEMAHQADLAGQIDAIGKAQAVIQFSLDGRILDANANFCAALGYSLDEIKGQHHSMFVDPAYRDSNEYKAFWAKLGRGEFDAGQYKRIGKGGREIWIQATYNPIMDASGRPIKVVKYAVDTTAQVKASRALEEAVAQTLAVVEEARGGNLAARIEIGDKEGQIRTLCDGINTLLESMAEVISQIASSADAVRVAASEISQGNVDLSSRTEEQAANVEETASTMEELTQTVQRNSENAGRANELASSAQQVAEKGGLVVKQVVATMSDIQSSSNRIADIISVIDGIAFQTNILALNAAVEAARAGEQGRGFAVVATEVRNLAQRSASAAKEIKSLITDSSDKVRNGTQQVDQAGKTMEDVVTSIKRVAEIMSEISGASRDQASGIEQVGHAVTQMDEVTQQNAALVEQAAAAAESLDEQANSLVEAVSRFRLGHQTHSRTDTAASRRIAAPKRPAAKPQAPPRPAAKALPASLDDEWVQF